MSYSVLEDNGVHTVVEKNTNHIICKFDNINKARQMCRRLNLGSGFNGMTPKFFSLLE